jgi:hypothetical protein
MRDPREDVQGCFGAVKVTSQSQMSQSMRVLKPVLMCLSALVVLAGVVNFFWVLSDDRGYGAPDAYAQLHKHLFYLSVALLFICFSFIFLGGLGPWLMGLRQGDAVMERVQAIRASGRLLATARCAGSVVNFRLGYPLAIFVELYPDGLTVRVLLEQTVAIRKEELRLVKVPKGRFGGRIELTYRSPDLHEPIVLVSSDRGDMVAALERYLEPVAPHAG